MRAEVCLLVGLGLMGSRALAEDNPHERTQPSGSITGKVFCGDTASPARMAKVRVQRVKTGSTAKPDSTLAENVEGTVVETDLNGESTFPRLPPGSYYVFAEMAGYMPATIGFTEKELDDTSPEMLQKLARALNRVTVQASQAESVQIRLERGAAVSGTILFDDGSPANGLYVQILQQRPGGKWERPLVVQSSMYFGNLTDDQGHFRISSLPPDTYIIGVDLSLQDEKQVMTQANGLGKTMFTMFTDRFTLPFYGHGSSRKRDATSFALTAGQERTGEDMTIPIGKLRKMSGVVTAEKDGHKVNAAKVVLADREDGQEVATTELSKDDGVFRFEFVPEGEYVLKTSDAREVIVEQVTNPQGVFPPTYEKEHLVKAYGPGEQPIQVHGEMPGVVLSVPEKDKQVEH